MSDDLKPRRAKRAVSDDEGARCVVALIEEFAARVTEAVKRPPDIRPPKGGMSRLGNRDRASYAWFLPCAETAAAADGTRPDSCNHGIGIDRQYGSYEVRAWAHGAPSVHDLSLHTHMVTVDHLETAARLIGLPFTERISAAGALTAECPTCGQDVPHDGAWLESHIGKHGRSCVGSGVNIHDPLVPYPQEYSFSDPEGA